jgi:hypothetical protein
MSGEEREKSLQDLLAEMLSSTAEGQSQQAPGEEATGPVPGEEEPHQGIVNEAKPMEAEAQQEGATTDQAGTGLAQAQVGEGQVDAVVAQELPSEGMVAAPPESETGTAHEVGMAQEAQVASAEEPGKPEPQAADLSERGQESPPPAEQATLQGKVEVRVAPPVNEARLSQLERELRERDDVSWLGTWGTAKEGTRLHLQLEHPSPLAQLFPRRDLVEKVEVAKKGKTWLLTVTLAQPSGSQEGQGEGVAAEGQPLPMEGSQLPSQEKGPRIGTEPPHPETVGQQRGFVELEVSPLHSLEDLSRFERLLASLGVRTTNVLSLDGVSTVLFSLEGADRLTLAQHLRERLPGISLEMGEGRMKARLPSS